jgi:hypothetical protein
VPRAGEIAMNRVTKICDELIEVLKGLKRFPETAQYNSEPDITIGAECIYIFWVLKGEPDRPAKSSKTIKITITTEALEKLENEKTQSTSLEAFKNVIKREMKDFNPDHNEPFGASPPLVEFLIDTSII